MSTARVEQLKRSLEALGFSEANEDFEIHGSGSNVVITVTIEVEDIPLPAVLQPFAYSPSELERAVRKGGSSKGSTNGANFELALQNYANHLMATDPETVALRNTLNTVTSKEEFEEYEAKRQSIWQRVSTTPELLALELDLEENYL
jgi:hypothetical protein